MKDRLFEGIFIGWVLCRASFGILDEFGAEANTTELFAVVLLVLLFVLMQLDNKFTS